MRGVCDFTDFFVIASGRNPRQTKAIYDEVAGTLKKDQRLLPRSSAGVREGDWIVGDYTDVVLHIFTPETRRLLQARGSLERRAVCRGRGGLARPLAGSRRQPDAVPVSVSGHDLTGRRRSLLLLVSELALECITGVLPLCVRCGPRLQYR